MHTTDTPNYLTTDESGNTSLCKISYQTTVASFL